MRYKKIVLVTARHSNEGWGTGNFIFKALNNLGCTIMRDYDFRINYCDMHFPEEADLLLMWKGSGVNVEQLAALDYPKVMWYPDDVRYPHAFKDCDYHAGHFDRWYTVIAENAPVMRDLFGQDASYLPPGVDLETFHPIEAKEKDIDVLFVGNPHSRRNEHLEYLQRVLPGVKIHIGKAFLDDLCTLVGRSKIIFNYGSFDRGMQLRIPETLACNAFLLTSYNKYVAQDFVPGVHLEMYNSPNQFVSMVEHYLTNDELRNRIALNGYNLIGKHTWEARLKTMFHDLSFTRQRRPRLFGGTVDSPHIPFTLENMG